jgi:hypothetical protein
MRRKKSRNEWFKSGGKRGKKVDIQNIVRKEITMCEIRARERDRSEEKKVVSEI